MKIALILPGEVWLSPFVNIYTKILDDISVSYSIISWNRSGNDKQSEFQYNKIPKNVHYSASLSEYYGYVKYVKSVLNNNHFDKLIVFCPQTVCMLADILLLKYKGRFMIDYRDLSIEQKFPFKYIYNYMLRKSSLNVISSPGFLKCLPKGYYLISHNFDEKIVREVLLKKENDYSGFTKGNIDILTIGGIRDISSNEEVIDGVSNKEGFTLRFVGRGDGAPILEDYATQLQAKNVSFKGYYEKSEEPDIVKTSTFLNIYYPRVITHDTALSNRFYNSLIFKKPMIVTKNTTQGDYAEKYAVGVAIENCNTLTEDLKGFLKRDYKTYCESCNYLLQSFLVDQEKFVKAVINYVYANKNNSSLFKLS